MKKETLYTFICEHALFGEDSISYLKDEYNIDVEPLEKPNRDGIFSKAKITGTFDNLLEYLVCHQMDLTTSIKKDFIKKFKKVK